LLLAGVSLPSIIGLAHATLAKSRRSVNTSPFLKPAADILPIVTATANSAMSPRSRLQVNLSELPTRRSSG
jgi:hypothetical protein